MTSLTEIATTAAPNILGLAALIIGITATALAYRLAWGMRKKHSPVVGKRLGVDAMRFIERMGTE